MKNTIEQNHQRGAELMQTIVQKSWEDSDFKNQLIKNPIGTIEKLTGKNANLPENRRMVVEDQTDASIIYLNIPMQPDLNEIELTEDQLEFVSGGSTPACAWVVVGFLGCWALDKVF